MYIVTRKNKVIDYCEYGYTYVGNIVVCEEKSRKFEDSTIVDIGDKELPSDLDIADYEYINGEFIRKCSEESLLKVTLIKEGWTPAGYSEYDTIRAGYTYFYNGSIPLLCNKEPVIFIDIDVRATLEQRKAASSASLYGSIVRNVDNLDEYLLYIGITSDYIPDEDIPIVICYQER